MARLRRDAPPPRYPPKRRKTVSLAVLNRLFVEETDLKAVLKKLQQMRPTRPILMRLWEQFERQGVRAELRDCLLAYCKARNCDPTAPPSGNMMRRRPEPGESRLYLVQNFKRSGRPYITVPLDTLTDDPERVKVFFSPDRRHVEVELFEG